MNDDTVAINEWRAKLDEHIDRSGGAGGCLEAARAASESRERERESDRTETRRGVVRKIGTSMAAVVGLRGASETVEASPEWPMTPISMSWGSRR